MRRHRRLATLMAACGMLVAPAGLALSVGAGTAHAQPWQLGPLHRAEFTGEAAEYFCTKSAAHAHSSRIIELVPCTFDPGNDSWYRIGLDTYGLIPRGYGSS